MGQRWPRHSGLCEGFTSVHAFIVVQVFIVVLVSACHVAMFEFNFAVLKSMLRLMWT